MNGTVLQNVKEFLRSNILTKDLYNLAYRLKCRHQTAMVRKNLHRNGYEVLSKMDKALQEYEIPYFCAYGTLLGFVRDNGFIAHDVDIDLAIMPKNNLFPIEDIQKICEELNGKITKVFRYEGQIWEVSTEITGIKIDLFLSGSFKYGTGSLGFILEENKEYPDPSSHTVVLITNPDIKGLSRLKLFDTYEYNVPTNAVEYLAHIYGPTWNIPDSKWQGSDGNARVTLPGFGSLEFL